MNIGPGPEGARAGGPGLEYRSTRTGPEDQGQQARARAPGVVSYRATGTEPGTRREKMTHTRRITGVVSYGATGTGPGTGREKMTHARRITHEHRSARATWAMTVGKFHSARAVEHRPGGAKARGLGEVSEGQGQGRGAGDQTGA